MFKLRLAVLFLGKRPRRGALKLYSGVHAALLKLCLSIPKDYVLTILLMIDWFTFGLVVLGVLVAYLVVSLGIHGYMEGIKRRPHEREFKAKAFEVSAIAPQIQQVRQNHVAAIRARPPVSSYRTELMALARQMIARAPYFRRQNSEEDHLETRIG